jgi:hypothetical protein
MSSGFPHSGIKKPVFLCITVSFSHHSSTHKTGFQAAIDSTGTIPKSSLIGIQIQAIQFPTHSVNQIFAGKVLNSIFFASFAKLKISCFCGSFSQ